jgi:predicted RNase H-like nuclease (RuvC/YqgF family)
MADAEGTAVTVAEAARLLGVPESEARALAGPDGKVPLAALAGDGGAGPVLELARELARAREEAGRLSGQLKEVRAANLRLQGELREGAEERRRLVAEVLELRAAAEERLMLMERVERIARIEGDLAESEAEVERLRGRGLLARLLNR